MDRRNFAQRLLTAVGPLILLALATPVAAERRPSAGHHHRPAASPRPGGPLHVFRLGHGPPVVFLHGLGSDSSVWIGEVERLSSSHTVVLIDLPGHGQSPAAPPHIELSLVARQVATALAAQQLGPAVVVGHSLGGTLAGYLALQAPQLVSGLVVVDTMFAPYGIAPLDRQRLRFALGRDQALALHDFFQPLAHDPRQLDKIVASARRVSSQTLIAYLDFVSDRDDLLTHAAELRLPVHVLASPLLTSGHSEPLAVRQALAGVGFGSVRNLSFDYFANANHFLFWDEPVAFHRSLERFLTQVELQPPPPGPAPLPRPRRNVAKAGRR